MHNNQWYTVLSNKENFYDELLWFPVKIFCINEVFKLASQVTTTDAKTSFFVSLSLYKLYQKNLIYQSKREKQKHNTQAQMFTCYSVKTCDHTQHIINIPHTIAVISCVQSIIIWKYQRELTVRH